MVYHLIFIVNHKNKNKEIEIMKDENIENLRQRIKVYKSCGIKFIINKSKINPDPFQRQPRTEEQRRLKIIEICPYHDINDINAMLDDVENEMYNKMVIEKIEDLCDDIIVEA